MVECLPSTFEDLGSILSTTRGKKNIRFISNSFILGYICYRKKNDFSQLLWGIQLWNLQVYCSCFLFALHAQLLIYLRADFPIIFIINHTSATRCACMVGFQLQS